MPAVEGQTEIPIIVTVEAQENDQSNMLTVEVMHLSPRICKSAKANFAQSCRIPGGGGLCLFIHGI